jgi:hypothetical protein
LEECLVCNQDVVGSNPTTSTTPHGFKPRERITALFLIAYTMANTNQIIGPQSNPDSWYEYMLDLYGTKIWEQPLVGMMVMFSLLLFPLLLALAKKPWYDLYKERMFALPGIFFLGWIGWLLVPY